MTNYTELNWREAILLGAALRDGLLDAVADGARTADDVARRLGMDVRAVYLVLSALAELGVLEEGKEGFWLRDEYRPALLDSEHPDYVGEKVVDDFEAIRSWSQLPEILTSGEPAEDYTSPGFEGEEEFVRAMRRRAMPGAEAVAGTVLPRLKKGAHILDVGGGPGINAEAFVRGGARVTVFDRPTVIEQVKEALSEVGIAAVGGDMNEALPEGPFDAVYLGHTSHMYGPEENRALFKRMRDCLLPGGLLAIKEFVRGMSKEAALFAVNMLVLTSRGGTYTVAEYEGWLREAGFEEVEFAPVPDRGTHLIFARNPR